MCWTRLIPADPVVPSKKKKPKGWKYVKVCIFLNRSQIEFLKIEVKSHLHFRAGGVQEELFHRQQRAGETEILKFAAELTDAI